MRQGNYSSTLNFFANFWPGNVDIKLQLYTERCLENNKKHKNLERNTQHLSSDHESCKIFIDQKL